MVAKPLAFPVTKQFGLGLLAAAVEAISAVALLATSAYLISRASEQPPILYLMVAVVGVRAFALSRAVFRYLQRLALHDSVFQHLTELRPKVFSKLGALAPGGMASRGEAIENFTSDIERLQELPLRVWVPVLQAIAALATMLTISLWLFPFATALLTSSAIIFAALALLFGSRSFAVAEDKRILLQQQLRESLLNYLGALDMLEEYHWAEKFRSRIRQLDAKLWALDRKRVVPVALAAALLALGGAVTSLAGSWAVAEKIEEILPATLAVATLMPLAVFDVFSSLQQVSGAWHSQKQSMRRLDALMSSQIPTELQLVSGHQKSYGPKVLKCVNLGIRRSGVEVIDKLNCEFRVGEITAVAGPSGSGKSSLAMTLASLIEPADGMVLLGNIPFSELDLEFRRRTVLLIEQDPHIFRGTVSQNLEISGVTDPSRLLDALSLVGLDLEFEARGLLEAEISQDAQNISGGQGQRLAIARGLLSNSSFLVLDEPTSGLDRGNSIALMEILRQITARGIGVIVITHDPEIAGLCDQTLRLVN